MSLLAGQIPDSSLRQSLFWMGAIVGALALHVGVALFFVWQPKSQLSLPPAAAPHAFEIAMVAAPISQTSDLPIGEEQEKSSPTQQKRNQAQPEKVAPIVEPLENLKSDVAVKNQEKAEKIEHEEIKPEETTPEEMPQQENVEGDSTGEKYVEESSAPVSVQAQEAEVASAPMEGAVSERDSQARATWQSLLHAHLERRKRYPRSAHLRKQQGVPWVSFTMDREGNVSDVKLYRSSGIASLDKEVVALVKRAEPLPVPPEEVSGETLSITLPVAFFIR